MNNIYTLHTFIAQRYYPLCLGLLLFSLFVPTVFGADLPNSTKKGEQPAAEVVAKREEEKHRTKAKYYETQADSYQQEIEASWKKFALERRKIAVLPKMVGENPHVRKLRLQTERNVAKLSLLRREAQESAQYHRFRAREWAEEQERLAAGN